MRPSFRVARPHYGFLHTFVPSGHSMVDHTEEGNQRMTAKWSVLLTSLAVVAASTVYAQAAPRTISVSITDSGFVPSNVVALINQPVQIQVVNKGRKVHQFSIPYYRIFSRNLEPGGTSTIGFSPWTAGRFEMISDPSGADKPEFLGTFIVTDHK
jgi:hypothetical protein